MTNREIYKLLFTDGKSKNIRVKCEKPNPFYSPLTQSQGIHPTYDIPYIRKIK